MDNRAVWTNNHGFHFARLDQRRIVVRVLILGRSIIRHWRLVRRIVRHVLTVIRAGNVHWLFTGSNQRLLFRIVRQRTGNAVINCLVLVRYRGTARIFRLHFDRLIVGTNHDRLTGPATSEEVIADPAKKHRRTGHAGQNKTTTATNRAITISFGSAAKIILRLHRSAFAKVASFKGLCTLGCPMVIEVVFIAQRIGGFWLCWRLGCCL